MLFESNVSQDRLREGAAPGNILDWVDRNDAFDAITAMLTVSATLRGNDGGTPIAGVHVTRGFFDVYRRQPKLGRTFHADEYEGAASTTSRQASSGEPVIVLSHRLWQTLGAEPQIVDRSVSVEGRDWRVIGVMPEDFAVPTRRRPSGRRGTCARRIAASDFRTARRATPVSCASPAA